MKAPENTPTLTWIADYYWRQRVAYRACDKQSIRRSVDLFKQYFGGIARPPYTQEQLNGYVAWRLLSVTGGTVRKELAYFLAMHKLAADDRFILQDDVPRVKRVLPAKPPPRDTWLTRPEAKALLAEASRERIKSRRDVKTACRYGRLYRFLCLALGTAARRGALMNLTWFQVQFEQQRISLNPPGRPQTSKKKPTVPIADWLYPLLVDFYGKRTSGNEYVLDSPDPSLNRQLKECAKRCGITKNVTPHVLRHTWVVWALQDGANLWDVAGVLGDDVETVKNNYGHHCPDYLRDVTNRGSPL